MKTKNKQQKKKVYHKGIINSEQSAGREAALGHKVKIPDGWEVKKVEEIFNFISTYSHLNHMQVISYDYILDYGKKIIANYEQEK